MRNESAITSQISLACQEVILEDCNGLGGKTVRTIGSACPHLKVFRLSSSAQDTQSSPIYDDDMLVLVGNCRNLLELNIHSAEHMSERGTAVEKGHSTTSKG